jgi:hypothetical protein
VALPPGTPLAGYGGFPRRAWVPDLLGWYPYAFWFRPSVGVHDPLKVRGLDLESGHVRLLWLAVDLVGVDPSLLADLRQRLARRGLGYAAMIISASHTHSGPGAYTGSWLFSLHRRPALAGGEGRSSTASRAPRGTRAAPGHGARRHGRAEVRDIEQSSRSI